MVNNNQSHENNSYSTNLNIFFTKLKITKHKN